jgi:predicted metal-dependent hydrolase
MQFELSFGWERLRAGEPQWLHVGGREMRLWLVRHRRARRYVLRLRPDGAARVTVPRGGSAAEARRFAEKHVHWLEQQLLRRAAEPAAPRSWMAGWEIPFRGDLVRLQIDAPVTLPEAPGLPRPILQAQGPGTVRFSTERVRVKDVSADLRPAVERHLWRLAARELPARVLELATLHSLPVQRVSVRNQRSRWGSCSRRGTVSLNWRLVQAPAFVRDYIILHELAHLREMNHSRRFWNEVARLCPGFETAEGWLKKNSALLK